MEPRGAVEKGAVEGGERIIPEDRPRSSSVSSASSADFGFEDPYSLEINGHGSFALENEQSEAAATSGGTLTLETPPVQVMERPPDESGYRIPAHVFSSNKSGTPNPEWSTASNESLFSIHTGNMSFTRDQFSWLLKSGDLGLSGGPCDAQKSGELPPPSPRIVLKSGEQKHLKASSTTTPPVAVNKPADVGVISPRKANEPLGAPGLTVSTQKDGPKPEVKDHKKNISLMSDDIRASAISPHHSDASGQSFAFPVLTDIDRDRSVHSGQSRADSRSRVNAADQEGGPKTPTSGPAPASTPSSWFSCFTCCSCC